MRLIIRSTQHRAQTIVRALNELATGIRPWAEMDGEDRARRILLHLHETRVDVERSLDLPVAPTIVCLCGSTRFGEEFRRAQFEETLAGRIVLTIGCNMRSDHDLFGGMDPGERDRIKTGLDELHKRKIDLADEVLILNVGGYIGDSTRSELEYAIARGKKVRYLEDPAKVHINQSLREESE